MRDNQCAQHQEFVGAVTELVATVSILSTNISWMERLGKWVAGLCVAMVCLIVVTIFYAGALYQQVEINTQQIQEFHRGGAEYVLSDEVQVASTD